MSFGAKEEIYGNYKVLDPDGCLMFRCDLKKFNWYIRKGLVEQVGPTIIKLNFQPAGKGYLHNSYCLQDRENICVVCGKKESLSRHHVVPYCYRKYFPEHIKRHNYYDVLPLCTGCHDSYEADFALKKRQELANRYSAPVHGVGIKDTCKQHNKACSAANTLFHHGHKVPVDKKKKLVHTVQEYLGKVPTVEDIQRMSEMSLSRYYKGPFYKSHGELVVSRIESLPEFVREWRKHFVSTMNPMFLPPGWGVDDMPIFPMEAEKA